MSPLSTYKIGNRIVKATITQPQPMMGQLDPTRQLVHVPDKYKAKGGDILTERNIPKMLLVNHHTIPGYRILLGLAINNTVTVTRNIRVINPITQMPGNTFAKTTIANVPIVTEIESDLREAKHLNGRVTIYLGQEVSINDLIDAVTVKSVKKVSGIYVAECM